jgi:hypothetical protein
MRGLGTPTNGIYPGYLRRVEQGVIQAPGGLTTGLHTWDFRTSDAPATVEAANYFNAWVADLPVGSVIQAVMGIGGTIELKHYVVSVNNGTAVTIKLQKTTAG